MLGRCELLRGTRFRGPLRRTTSFWSFCGVSSKHWGLAASPGNRSRLRWRSIALERTEFGMAKGEEGDQHSAAELLGDWRAAERDTAAAKSAASVAALALDAAVDRQIRHHARAQVPIVPISQGRPTNASWQQLRCAAVASRPGHTLATGTGPSHQRSRRLAFKERIDGPSRSAEPCPRRHDGQRVFGAPYEKDGVTVIPVANITGGAGGAAGVGQESRRALARRSPTARRSRGTGSVTGCGRPRRAST